MDLWITRYIIYAEYLNQLLGKEIKENKQEKWKERKSKQKRK
jgi:hypothetical protein